MRCHLSPPILKYLFVFVSTGYNTPHERNENSSPPSTMLSSHQHPQQPGSQHSPVNNNMTYNNMHMTSSIQKNLANAAPSGGYHIPNMKEEPNNSQNNYSNLVNNGGNGVGPPEDLSVSNQFNSFSFGTLVDDSYTRLFD